MGFSLERPGLLRRLNALTVSMLWVLHVVIKWWILCWHNHINLLSLYRVVLLPVVCLLFQHSTPPSSTPSSRNHHHTRSLSSTSIPTWMITIAMSMSTGVLMSTRHWSRLSWCPLVVVSGMCWCDREVQHSTRCCRNNAGSVPMYVSQLSDTVKSLEYKTHQISNLNASRFI